MLSSGKQGTEKLWYVFVSYLSYFQFVRGMPLPEGKRQEVVKLMAGIQLQYELGLVLYDREMWVSQNHIWDGWIVMTPQTRRDLIFRKFKL